VALVLWANTTPDRLDNRRTTYTGSIPGTPNESETGLIPASRIHPVSLYRYRIHPSVGADFVYNQCLWIRVMYVGS
jgi:hypothetical protein